MGRTALIKEIFLDKSIEEFYQCIVELPYCFLLDSGLATGGGRYSFMGADPFAVIHSKAGKTTLAQSFGSRLVNISVQQDNPLDVMADIFNSFPPLEVEEKIPFSGGGVGFFSYDLGRQLERMPELAADDLNTPDLIFGLFDVILVVDQLENRKYIVSTGYPEKLEKNATNRAMLRSEWLQGQLAKSPGLKKSRGNNSPVKVQANFNRQSYIKNVGQAIEHILSGDIFQVNLSQRFTMESEISGWQLYKDLKRISPAPFAAYLNFGDIEVISSSPERFLRVEQYGGVETCPIKGTRPRASNPAEDLSNYKQLLESQKDRAELTMIVDLARSDLGRVCRPGTIRAELPYCIEPFPTVFHLVATVKGSLIPGKNIFDLLKASFPGGSITGAPKIKAMEIIECLEPVRRGIYTGSLGYIGFDGRADLNIVIRTIIKVGGKYYFQVGGGITAKSNPEDEYNETLDKARALLRALKFEGSIYDGPYVY
ncbi:aminodeoxychorismate synthase component I [Desulforamulus aquiferis]|uniref:aminodeoxychorismate synthase n=1 Tax=Desulforamulus aquiferis TaxID=1397668 RepID=A0AAW7ZBL6_9FIRM|nr:aminodeoxychorismate synthase component I [Desulforamulus aquiferis]MDO7786935.1 aminodeoxychorismate synthase component I [Desulforamulus aquiferis]